MPSYSGAGAGAYGALGGIISFEFVPDPNVYAAKFMELAGYLENFIPPLEASKGIAKQDMEMHFQTESSPDGAAWAQLNPQYASKRGSAHPILQLTGAMHDAAVSDSAYTIDGHDLFFNTGGLPPYWIFHETGREGKGAADLAAWARHARSMGLEVDEAQLGTIDGGMPARPFVGISFDAQMAIIEAFDAWFEGGVAGFYTRPSGAVQTRDIRGRFGPKVGG